MRRPRSVIKVKCQRSSEFSHSRLPTAVDPEAYEVNLVVQRKLSNRRSPLAICSVVDKCVMTRAIAGGCCSR